MSEYAKVKTGKLVLKGEKSRLVDYMSFPIFNKFYFYLNVDFCFVS